MEMNLEIGLGWEFLFFSKYCLRYVSVSSIFLKHYDSKKAHGIISAVEEEQEIKMNSTHPNSQRNIGSEAYSK